MSGIFDWFDKIFQAIFVKSVMAHFEWLDWVTAVIVMVGIVYGARRGLMREIVEILEMILITILVLLYQKPLASLFGIYLSFIHAASIPAVSFILLASAIWGLVIFIDGHIKKWLHAQLPVWLKTAGGALLGAVHFLIIWSFLSYGILLLPLPKLRKNYDSGQSYSGVLVKEIAPKILKIAQSPFALVPPKA